MANILLIQDTDWILRGPHQQHHIFERLDQDEYSIWVVDFEILWDKQRTGALFQKQRIFNNITHVMENKIEIVRPAMIRIPLLDKLTIPIFHTRVINRLIKQKKINLIVGQTILNTICGLFLSKIYKIPFIYHVMDSIHSIASDYIPSCFLFLAKVLERLVIRFSDSIIAVNKGLKDYVIRLGAKSEKVFVVAEGVDYKKYQDARIDRDRIRRDLGLKKDDLVLFFMGWLYSFSGLKELADHIARISDSKLKLLVVGEGDLFDYLSALSKESDQIIVTGQVPFEKIPSYLSAADIGILPALRNEIMMDIVPIKIIEYMAAGKPVISTRLRGILREFGENNGIIYCDSVEKLSRIALQLRTDNELGSVGKQGAEFVKGRDWKILVKKFEDVLKTVMKNYES
jgi:glycosyltransferase involved in cell wall biosynthesis